MTRVDRTGRGGWASLVEREWRRRLSAARAREEGQALILTLVVIMLLVLIAPVIVSQISFEGANVAQNVNYEGALAAAEAGVSAYRNLLDVDSNYWQFNSSNWSSAQGGSGDVALEVNGWVSVPGAKPAEAYHYIPNISQLKNGGGSGTATVILTVTGRSGKPGSYVYRTIQTSMESRGVLADAYFSQYETEDWQQNTSPVTVKTYTNGVLTSTVTDTMTTTPPVESQKTFWQSLCQYDNYQPNTFVDGLTGSNAIGDVYAGGTYSPSTPYYGAFRGNAPDTTNHTNNNSFTYTYPAVTVGGTTTQQVATVTDPCKGIFNFVSGETFNGPVYSKDQLWMCGNPVFNQGLTSGIPKGFSYAAGSNWPTHNSYSGTNGWIDNGRVDWDGNCGLGGTSSPTFGTRGLAQAGNQSLPPLNGLLQTVAQQSGCVFTGPTMIDFVPGGTYDVWSPLTNGSSGSSASCPRLDSSNGYTALGVTVPSSGLVIYVQNAPSTTTIPALSSFIGSTLPTGATCLDPWKPYVPASGSPCPQAFEGDLIVGGEVQGQVTLAAQDNIVISRPLTYTCADASGVNGQRSPTYSLSSPSSPCVTEASPDIVGLVANADVVLSKPGVALSESQLPPTGNTDDKVPSQTEPYEWPADTTAYSGGNCPASQDGTETPGSNSAFYTDIVPNCALNNPVVDAAIVGLQGSFADEDWDMGSLEGNAYLQGTDISDLRGPFGSSGGINSGYNKEFSYDTRLLYLTPPSMLDIASLTWLPTSFITCGSVNDGGTGNPNANICPGLNWLSS